MNYPEKYGLHATTIILRRHNDSLLKEAMSAWHDQVLRYSKRDQLSFDMVKHYFDLKVETFDESLLQNEFFQWPVFYGHGRLPRDFDDAEYLSINPDVALSKTNPRKHYLEFGMASGRPYRVLPLNDTPPTTHFEVDPRDQRGKELKLSQTGQLNETTNAMWKVLLKESDWTDIVDIGANYGEMLVGANIPPLSSVIAIEPNPTIFPLLRRNLIAAGVKCDCLALAISDGVGLAKLNIDLRWSGLSTLEAVPDSLSAEKEIVCVPMMSLDALFGKVSNINKMRLLTKIDIEGHEISALKGMHNLINSSEKFAALVEVLHLSKPSKAWLLERFEIEVYNLSTKKLKKITPLSIDKFEEVLLNEAIYKNDIVIRAR